MHATIGPSRRGFTLVELLMVITIIAILVGLSVRGIWRSLILARQTQLSMEIGQLDSAMQAYNDKAYEFPPNMAPYQVDANNNREKRFEQHIRVAWPRASLSYTSARNDIAKYFNYDANQGQGASLQPLNLDTLDPAESLVFWLGGLPTPLDASTKAPVEGKKLFGFHKDELRPFFRDRREVEAINPLQYRTVQLFEFDETRLVDHDNDGWLEYLPQGSVAGGGALMPPFVYFDSRSYWGNNEPNHFPADPGFMAQWGLAVPHALFFDPARKTPTRWVNPTTFQIVSAGIDGYYGPPSGGSGGLPLKRVPVHPKGQVYLGPGFSNNPPKFYSNEELDNQTNFTERTLESALD